MPQRDKSEPESSRELTTLEKIYEILHTSREISPAFLAGVLIPPWLYRDLTQELRQLDHEIKLLKMHEESSIAGMENNQKMIGMLFGHALDLATRELEDALGTDAPTDHNATETPENVHATPR